MQDHITLTVYSPKSTIVLCHGIHICYSCDLAPPDLWMFSKSKKKEDVKILYPLLKVKLLCSTESKVNILHENSVQIYIWKNAQHKNGDYYSKIPLKFGIEINLL